MTTAFFIAIGIAGPAVTVLALLLWRSRRAEAAARRDAAGQAAAAAERLAETEGTVTEARASLAAAEAEAERLRELLDHLPQPVWRRDSELRLDYCNAAYARAVDRPAEGALATAAPLVEDADQAAAERLAATALAEGAARAERFHLVVEGQRRLMELTETPLPDGSLLGHARDLTDWEEVTQDLDRHLQAQRAILEQLGVGIAIFGADMRLSFHNAAYAAIWGLDERFLAGQPHITDLLEWLREHRRLPEQADFAAFRRQKLRQLQSLIEPEEELQHLPDGTALRAGLHPHPFGGVIQTYEDVTDRLQLERTYNTLLAVQRETLDSLHEGVAVFGADGRLRLSNPAFARIWDVPLEWLAEMPHVRDLAQRCRRFFDTPDEAWPAQLERMVARATDPDSGRGRVERTDGSVIEWIQVPLPDGDCVFSYIDATDSARVERALRERNEALETADRLKSEFIANISYELRTPLNAIIGFAEILQNRYFGELNERQQEYAGAIVESSDRLMALINDILDLASIEAGYLQLEYGEVDLQRLFESMQTLWHERARARHLTLEVRCNDGIGSLWCDERRIGQALFNLLSNAFRFTPDGGKVEVTVERLDGEVVVRVHDDGIGIPPDEQARILGRFERGRLSRARRRRAGAGLGLALAKSLVELHGGWLDLESEVNQGTSVVCHLPDRRDEPASPASATPPDSPPTSRPTGD